METKTVNTEMWGNQEWNGKCEVFEGDRPIAIKVKPKDAELIVTAVNACKTINPDNPLAVANQIVNLYEALVEASSLFDNYPQLYEMKGTYEVIWNAINKSTALKQATE